MCLRKWVERARGEDDELISYLSKRLSSFSVSSPPPKFFSSLYLRVHTRHDLGIRGWGGEREKKLAFALTMLAKSPLILVVYPCSTDGGTLGTSIRHWALSHYVAIYTGRHSEGGLRMSKGEKLVVKRAYSVQGMCGFWSIFRDNMKEKLVKPFFHKRCYCAIKQRECHGVFLDIFSVSKMSGGKET